MNDATTPRHPYGDDVHFFFGVPCIARTQVPVALVEHLVDSGMSDVGILLLLPTLPLPPIVRIANARRDAV